MVPERPLPNACLTATGTDGAALFYESSRCQDFQQSSHLIRLNSARSGRSICYMLGTFEP